MSSLFKKKVSKFNSLNSKKSTHELEEEMVTLSKEALTWSLSWHEVIHVGLTSQQQLRMAIYEARDAKIDFILKKIPNGKFYQIIPFMCMFLLYNWSLYIIIGNHIDYVIIRGIFQPNA